MDDAWVMVSELEADLWGAEQLEAAFLHQLSEVDGFRRYRLVAT